MKDIIFWLAVGVFYVAFCYQIGQLSIEVYKRWDDKDDDTLPTWIGLRVILFPMNSLNKAWNREPEWLAVAEVAGVPGKQAGYKFAHIILAPLKLFWFAVGCACFFVIAPVVSLVCAGLWRTARGFVLLIRSAIS